MLTGIYGEKTKPGDNPKQPVLFLRKYTQHDSLDDTKVAKSLSLSRRCRNLPLSNI